MSIYDDSFYNYIDEGALRSARIIVPHIIKIFSPQSVIDIGCGTGAWLSVFEEMGVTDLHGVDGYYNKHAPVILGDRFEIADLSKPFIPSKKYDLALTFEVAEHISPECADVFIASVTSCSDNIVWSAAVPGQRGLNHVNEQFPSYWIPKFESFGYKCNGEFRNQFWYNENIENWYRQNILLFSKTHNWTDPVKDLIHYNNYPNYGGDVEEKYKYNE